MSGFMSLIFPFSHILLPDLKSFFYDTGQLAIRLLELHAFHVYCPISRRRLFLTIPLRFQVHFADLETMAVVTVRHLKAKSLFSLAYNPLFYQTDVYRQNSSFNDSDGSGARNLEPQQLPNYDPISTESKRERLIDHIRLADTRRKAYLGFMDKRLNDGKVAEVKEKFRSPS